MRYYLIAGEASGDLHGSNLMKGLIETDPDARFRFWGGEKMRDAWQQSHSIREEDVLRRFAGRWEAVAKVLPYCDEARFFDNYNGFVEVAEYINGELIVKGDARPLWVQELRAYLG